MIWVNVIPESEGPKTWKECYVACVIDAWLELRTPKLRILEVTTGSVLACIEGAEVGAALDRYDVSPVDLLRNDFIAHERIATGLIAEWRNRQASTYADNYPDTLNPVRNY